MESVFPKCLLFQPFKQSGEVFKPARVNFQIKQVTVSIEEFVGRKGVNAKIAFDSCLLFIAYFLPSHNKTDKKVELKHCLFFLLYIRYCIYTISHQCFYVVP